MKNFAEYTEQLHSAVARGAAQLKKTIGGQVDQDLKLYERMTPKAFDLIRQKYGEDALVEYIKTMEAKKHGIQT